MSKVITVNDVTVNDINAVREVIKQLGKEGIQCSLQENAAPRVYYDNAPHCDYVIKFHNSKYDLGLKKTNDKYELVFDDLGGHIASQIGNRKIIRESGPYYARGKDAISYFTQLYTANRITMESRRRGLSSTSSVDKDNNIIMNIRY